MKYTLSISLVELGQKTFKTRFELAITANKAKTYDFDNIPETTDPHSDDSNTKAPRVGLSAPSEVQS